MSYAELRARTHYSFLRGASHPAEMIVRAAELGLKAIAITDRDGVYGIPKAFLAAQENPGVKLIVGAELTLGDRRSRLALLAKNRAGYGLMCRLLTASHEGKPKGQAALEWPRLFQMLETFREGREGLFAIADESAQPETLAALRDLFGGRFYLPISRFLDGKDDARWARALQLSRELGIPLVATNDAHYHLPEKRPLQDVLVSIREGKKLDEAGGLLFPNAERYLKSPAQMRELFNDLPEALDNTLKIAEQCMFSPSELRYRYPSEWIPQGETAQAYLERLTWEGARGRYPEGIPDDVRAQLEHEFKLISELNFSDYFLTIWEIVEFAKSRKILCQGRGSAANSAVCFCLGITAIDPVRMKLLFERFLSAERGEPPDIDVDFEHERREEVIQHIYEKYGRDRAGMVAAVITYRSRSARREVRKAFGIDPDIKLAEEDPRVESMMEEIMGFPRHLSIHSGGFTLSADPIIETVPIEPARMEGRTIVQWDKEDLAAIGLLKVDILALGMLTAISRTFDMIRPPLTIATIPPDDPATYAMLKRADTVGVFQIESRAQMNMLHRLQPENFYDLVVEVALVRPGPIVGQMVHPYLRRRRGLESSASPDPRLEPILGRTLGVPLFQEQVMKMAIVMADFTPGEADQLRRAIGAWRSNGTIEKMGRKLMEGLLRNGLPRDFVERVFLQIRGFAEYGFPESHAASFALLAYASSYLKCHFPAEFTCSLINSQPMGFYAIHTLVEDAKRHGVKVLPLDPRVSDWECTIDAGALRLGWRTVNGIAEADVKRLLGERPFNGLADFISRSRLSVRMLNRLAMGGAFQCFGYQPREALWEILSHRHLRASAQMDLFQHVEGGARQSFQRLSDYESIQADYEAYGVSVQGHPMRPLREMGVRKVPATTSVMAKQAPSGRAIRIAGLIIARQRPSTAKGSVFATLEDEYGFVDLFLPEKVFERSKEVFVSDPFVIVRGMLQRDRGAVSILVRSVESLTELLFTDREEAALRARSYDFH